MYTNQFSVVVFKRQHYVFHIFTGYTFVRHFPVLQIQRPRPCQYSGRREASFELSNATIYPHGLKLWCSDRAIDNALRG